MVSARSTASCMASMTWVTVSSSELGDEPDWANALLR